MTIDISPAMSRRVRGHLRTVSANLHTAPPPRAFLAGVVEVQHTVTAFTNLRPIKISQQRGDAVRHRPKQVFGFARITIRLIPEASSVTINLVCIGWVAISLLISSTVAF